MPLKKAAANGHFDTFKWLYENRSKPFGPDLSSLDMHAYENTLKCLALYTKHDRFGSFVDKLVRGGYYETVDLLVAKARAEAVKSVEREVVDTRRN